MLLYVVLNEILLYFSGKCLLCKKIACPRSISIFKIDWLSSSIYFASTQFTVYSYCFLFVQDFFYGFLLILNVFVYFFPTTCAHHSFINALAKMLLKFKSNLSLYSLYYTETCNEFAGAILRVIAPGQHSSFEEMSLGWWAVRNSVSDLTGRRFESQTFRCRDERAIAR